MADRVNPEPAVAVAVLVVPTIPKRKAPAEDVAEVDVVIEHGELEQVPDPVAAALPFTVTPETS